VGLPGASHMLMQDKHSLQIGQWLVNWIDQTSALDVSNTHLIAHNIQ
jgi:hypothetical protein